MDKCAREAIPTPDTALMVKRLEKFRHRIDPVFCERVEGLLRLLELMGRGLEGEERLSKSGQSFEVDDSIVLKFKELCDAGADYEETEVLLLSYGLIQDFDPERQDIYKARRLSTAYSSRLLRPASRISKLMVRPFWEASSLSRSRMASQVSASR